MFEVEFIQQFRLIISFDVTHSDGHQEVARKHDPHMRTDQVDSVINFDLYLVTIVDLDYPEFEKIFLLIKSQDVRILQRLELVNLF